MSLKDYAPKALSAPKPLEVQVLVWKPCVLYPLDCSFKAWVIFKHSVHSQ